jgi:Mg2+ and Co2+ transporter CorA
VSGGDEHAFWWVMIPMLLSGALMYYLFRPRR